MRVVGYARCSTDEQAASGAGLQAQRDAILAETTRRGWELVAVFEDAAASGKSLNGRPGLAGAQGAIESGEAEALVVTRVDRLSRSLMDFAGIVERSRRRGWALVVLDLNVDTSTPSGEMVGSVLAVFAQFERRLIGQRTKEALAVKKSQGIRLGRPRSVPDEIRARIVRSRAAGMTLRAIADELNSEAVPTGQGGTRWHMETVRQIVRGS